jgi:hypothetical protein
VLHVIKRFLFVEITFLGKTLVLFNQYALSVHFIAVSRLQTEKLFVAHYVALNNDVSSLGLSRLHLHHFTSRVYMEMEKVEKSVSDSLCSMTHRLRNTKNQWMQIGGLQHWVGSECVVN